MIIADPEILVVDDSVTDVLLMRTVFDRAGFGHPLHFACDGEEAIAYLRGDGEYRDRRQHPLPAVMLLDLNMPRKDGFEVLAWVRQQPALRCLRIYVLSASSQAADIRRCYDLGANVYLVKPRNLDGLMHLAKTLLAWIRLGHFAALGEPDAGLPAWTAASPASFPRIEISLPSSLMNIDKRSHPVQQLADDENALRDARFVRVIQEQAAELRALGAEREAFVRTLRHDLNSPLMSIGGFADLLLDQAGAQLDEKSRQYLLAIITAAEQLKHLVNEAATFPRVSQGERGDTSGGSGAVRTNGADEAIVARQFAVAVE